ncbi:SH3 domain-containing protein [Helicobacter turcicus]|uniref:SH3 domain-containing protein n=1 Tax=Helicobacter turcicus TaxID=2867412 RepID=A0ABS7JLB5_9HELI|nr:SH3 domain-containing protein [Helicobacter turcicus]MBX7490190.1 SH3 domain-containing protein [Helicobacter turcicus]MBX7545231.1 SH3 domain-containing protein [Helicobacter turcicus]
MRIVFVFLCVFGVVFAEETRIFPESPRSVENVQDTQNQKEQNLDSKAFGIPNTIVENTESKTNSASQTLLPNVVIEDDVESKNTLEIPKTQDSTIDDSLIPSNPTLNAISSNTASKSFLVKNIYLEALTPLMDILYVEQVVALEFKMLVFTQYSTIDTEFIFEDSALKNSVEVLNPKQDWVLNAEDSSLRNTFYLKIKQSQFAIPNVKVSVHTIDGLVSESLAGSVGRAIKLERKGAYSQVLAQDLQILETKITSYDSTQNLAVFQLQSTMGNLFDFKLENYEQQGIESKSGDYKQAVAFYYVIVPKTLNTISFDYFNTQTSKYQTLQVPNIASEDRVSTQSDIKPKNNYQFFQISLMIFFALVFFGLYVYKRKIIFILLAVFALMFLLYFLTLKSEVTIKANVALRIQPTFNSTIFLVTQGATQAEILGTRNNYYKVILEDERIGWIKKDDIQN